MSGKATITYNGSVISTEERDGNFPITYNGSTIATVEPGQTKTLNCAGKLMRTNVAIGGKTLNCAKKKMASNVIVSVENLAMNLADVPEGALIAVNESGTPALYYLACHNYESANNGAGRTLLVRMLIRGTAAFRSSGNKYSGGKLDSTLTSTHFGYFSAALQAAIGTTVIPVTTTTGSIIAGKLGTVSKSVFQLSVAEYGLSGGKAEGSVLPIASTLRRAKSSADKYVYHWTRTPNYQNTTNAYAITSSGTVEDIAATTSTYSMRPAFTLPNTMQVNGTPNADGSYTLIE